MDLPVSKINGSHWDKTKPTSRGSRKQSVSLHFLVSRGHLHSLACGPFLLQNQQHSIFKPLPDFEGSCDHIELTQIMQDNFLILTSADQQLIFYLPPFFPFPRNITYPQALGTGKGHLWQGCYTVYHKLVFDFPENKFSSLLCEDRCYSSCLGLHSAKTQTSSILLLHHQYMASSSWSKMIS